MKKTFEQFARACDGNIDLRGVPTMFRTMNIQTSAESLDIAVRQLRFPRTGCLDFQAFVELASKFITEEDKETTIYELKEAFRYSIISTNVSNDLIIRRRQ